jgi:hypothetical protein
MAWLQGARRYQTRPGALILSFTSVFSTKLDSTEPCPAEMATDSEFKIQTRFERHEEFVALQNEALAFDISPQASDEESNRRINLMRDMINIVRWN